MNRGVGMLESGVSQGHVARILNVSQSAISAMWNHHLTQGDPSHIHGGRRDRDMTQHQDVFCLFSLEVNRF